MDVVYNMGVNGLATLIAMSVVFGVVVGLITWRSASHWIGLVGAVAFFLGGLLTSEVLFATATEAELQPNIDGLSFDEALLGGLILGLLATIVGWLLTRRSRRTGATPV